MILKLIKYEWRATYKTFFLLFLGILLLSLMPALGLIVKSEMLLNFALFSVGISFFPLVIVYLVLTVQRYYKSIYAEEGYLLLTLPVKPGEIIVSKILLFTFWGVIAMLVGGIVFIVLIVTATSMEGDRAYFEVLFLFLKDLKGACSLIGMENLLWMGIVTLFLGIGIIIKIYLAITLGNLPYFRQWNDGLAVIFFFLLSVVEDKVIHTINHIGGASIVMELQPETSIAVWSYPIIQVVFIAIFTTLTILLIQKKIQVK